MAALNDLRSTVKTCPWADIPTSELLQAEIFGVDYLSYFHIGFLDNRISESYTLMLTKMEETVRGKRCVEKTELVYEEQLGFPCIVEYPGHRGGSYSRATIIETDLTYEEVYCVLIDDFKEISVPRTKVYHTAPEVLAFPLFALKCQLDEMDCFLNTSILQVMYDKHMEGMKYPCDHSCIVKILTPDRPVPIVHLQLCSGRNMAHLLQDMLPTMSRPAYPKPDDPVSVKIVHCNQYGKFWFQYAEGKDQVIRLINEKLRRFRPPKFPTGIYFPECEGSSWKVHFFSGEGALFIYKDGKASFRVQILERDLSGTAKVNFVDLGCTEEVKQDNLYPLYWLDQNLCLIAPQCLPAVLTGMVGKFNDENPFNKEHLMSLTKIHPTYLLNKGSGVLNLDPEVKGLLVPEVDLLIRSKNTPKSNLGYSLVETLNLGKENSAAEADSSSPSTN